MNFIKDNNENILNFLKRSNLLEASFFDVKNFRYFIRKYDLHFYFYDYKKILSNLLKASFLLKKAHQSGNKILIIGLSSRDSRFFATFNRSLKLLSRRYGHSYLDKVSANAVYDYYSYFKRRSVKDRTSIKKLPGVLLSFSRDVREDVYKEFSFAGIPVLFFFGDYSRLDASFKDYPLFGPYSKKVLSFYLDFLNYCFYSSKN